MPETKKGKKIKRSMRKTYGKKKGDEVFYASANAGTITGVHKKKTAAKKRPAKVAKRPTKRAKRSRRS